MKFYLSKKPIASQRRTMRHYGVKYSYRAGETPEEELEAPKEPVETAV